MPPPVSSRLPLSFGNVEVTNSAHPSALSWANRYLQHGRKWHGRGCVILCVRMLTMAAATRAIAKTLDDRGWFHYRLYANEKLGGNPPPVRSMDDFHEAISLANLIDAGFLGSKWTWCNKQEEQACIRARLDRCLINSCWQVQFLHTTAPESNTWMKIMPRCCYPSATQQTGNQDPSGFNKCGPHMLISDPW